MPKSLIVQEVSCKNRTAFWFPASVNSFSKQPSIICLLTPLPQGSTSSAENLQRFFFSVKSFVKLCFVYSLKIFCTISNHHNLSCRKTTQQTAMYRIQIDCTSTALQDQLKNGILTQEFSEQLQILKLDRACETKQNNMQLNDTRNLIYDLHGIL